MKGIFFRGNLKQNLTPFEEAEIVYAVDTNEWGLAIETQNGLEFKWRKITNPHFIESVSQETEYKDGTIFLDTDTYEYFRKTPQGFEKIPIYLTEDQCDILFVPKNSLDINSILKTDGSTPVQNNFNEFGGTTVLSKERLFEIFGSLKSNGTTQMTNKYVSGKQVLFKGANALINVYNSYIEAPSNTLYEKNGDIYYKEPIGHIRYFTTQPLTFSDGITRNPTNGYIDIIGNDEIYLDLPYDGPQKYVTKIQVLNYGNRTSWYQLANRCTGLTEFEVLATDESKVENFEAFLYQCTSLSSLPELDVSNGINFSYAWASCSSLTSFPVLDVSNGTDFFAAWYNCYSLTSFPVLDVSNGTDFGSAFNLCSSLTSFPELDVSNGTNFRSAWASCYSLTSFPVLDVSNGTDFESTWYYCTSLTSFPELDVSNGTNFYGAWRTCPSLTSFPVLDVSNGANFDSAWYGCSSLTSFPVLDVSNGTNFSWAWRDCRSLTSFPQLDLSSGTSFRGAWYGCKGLTSFSQIDVSSGINFGDAWKYCSSLTSFPVLDVSNGTNFSWAWYYCSKLPHCPAGNELTIPSGADTTGMCASCCTE